MNNYDNGKSLFFECYEYRGDMTAMCTPFFYICVFLVNVIMMQFTYTM